MATGIDPGACTAPRAALEHDHVLDRRRARTSASSATCLSGTICPRRYPPSAVTSSRACASLMRSRSDFGAETAEDDAVNGADARAGEHRDRELGHERHVNRHAIALPDAERLEDVGERPTLRETARSTSSVRRSPGSPSQMIAALLRRAPRTWRSRQLTATFSWPPTNHLACGGCQSSTVSHRRDHSSSPAKPAQNASGSRSASA